MGERGPSPEEVRATSALLVRRLVEEAVAELDLPHVVICTHVATGITCYQGPYPDALAAATAAERDIVGLGGPDGEGELRFTIAPLTATEPC